MKITEEKKDLFTVSDNYYLAHCISANFALGAGIAVKFSKEFDMKNKLREKYPNYMEVYNNLKLSGIDGDCIKIDRVLNLVTKRQHWDKPTYKSVQDALTKMKEICIEENIEKIAMPLIACGLDRLMWDKVKTILMEVFAETDCEILVCVL